MPSKPRKKSRLDVARLPVVLACHPADAMIVFGDCTATRDLDGAAGATVADGQSTDGAATTVQTCCAAKAGEAQGQTET